MSLTVEDLHFAYGDHTVLDGVSFEVPDGMLVGVLGHNGVGKSTLFRCILGLNTRWTGKITINGNDVHDLSIRQMAKEIAYIPQSHDPTYNYEVLDIVLMSTTSSLGALSNPKPEHVELAYSCLEKVGIESMAQRTFTQISGGEQQLVLVARALAQQAKTIIMDEPTSALDYGNQVRVLSQVRKLADDGYTIVSSTHQPDQAFLYSDKTLVINDGRVLCYGPPKDIVTSELVKKIYGVNVSVESLYDDQVRVCVPVDEIRTKGVRAH